MTCNMQTSPVKPKQQSWLLSSDLSKRPSKEEGPLKDTKSYNHSFYNLQQQ
jgi:hypothetical protein